jgi:L-Ala-D/L-Glu epimerase
MRIKNVGTWLLKLPFLSPIRHNLATHEGSENIIVKVTTADGVTGYGEGIPRGFVTGETLAGSLAFLRQVLAPAALSLKFASPRDLPDLLEGLRQRLKATAFPAAFCALETAVLDAAGKTWDLPVSEFLGPLRHQSVIYSAVIPLASEAKMQQLFLLVKLNRMHFIKLKVGIPEDLQVLAMAREALGPVVDLRVDANSAWSPSQAIDRINAMAPFRISAVEQPVAKEDFQGLKAVQAGIAVPIIADESVCTMDDAQSLIDLKACQIFNLRLSKCGGLLNAQRILNLAESAGIRCQLGCHVGETSILAAAGRHFAQAAPELVYLEGSFAPYLLTRDPVAQSVTFGSQGEASALTTPGLGVEVLEDVLNELAASPFEESEAAG